MTARPPGRQARSRRGGYSLMEFGVAVAVLGVIITVLLQRITAYQDGAELAARDQVLGSLRSALHLRVAGLVAQGRAGEIAQLANQNPMDHLAEKPRNYLGEYYAPEAAELAPGSWYFDRTTRVLVYMLKSHTLSVQKNSDLTKYKVVFSGLPKKNAKPPAPQDASEGVVLDQVFD